MFVDTLAYIINKYKLDINQRMPIEIPDVTRNAMAALFGEMGFKIGAEIGTEQGAYAEVLCRVIPNLHLFCVDAWTAYSGYREHVSQEKLDKFYEATQQRLNPYNATLMRKFSLNAARDFEEASLDFVYIDANHEYRQVVDDISVWTPKVRKGGIVSGHDFIRRKNPAYLCHVVEAVMGYTQAYHISPWFVLGARNDGNREKVRSWMWVKA
jgi:predicted O-methyltransferase YrrM